MKSDIDIQNLSPDHQLHGFSRTPFMRNFMLAAIAHILVIGLTSVAFLAELGQEENDEEDGNKTEQVDGSGSEAGSDEALSAEGSDVGSGEPAGSEITSGGSDGSGSGSREQSEYEKKLLDAANPDELPKGPMDSDLDLNDIGL